MDELRPLEEIQPMFWEGTFVGDWGGIFPLTTLFDGYFLAIQCDRLMGDIRESWLVFTRQAQSSDITSRATIVRRAMTVAN